MMDKDLGRQCLLKTAEILDRVGLPFFLMQGTALGAYRDKGFTPTERDIDFGVLVEDFVPRAVPLACMLSQAAYRLEMYAGPFGFPRTIVAWSPGGIHVDIVGWIRWKDRRFTYSPVHPTINHEAGEAYAIVHDRAILETYQPVDLFGRQFNVPSPIEEYLRREYGDDWRTPREDHVSRTRVYGFLEKEQVPLDLHP